MRIYFCKIIYKLGQTDDLTILKIIKSFIKFKK